MGTFSPIVVNTPMATISENVSEVLDREVAEQFVVYQDLNQEDPGSDATLTNMDAVEQALRNLFNTKPGERLFRPTFGADLGAILFQPIDAGTSLRLKQLLIKAVEQWEPRIKVDRRNTSIVPQPEENGYDISITYQVLGIPEEYFDFTAFYQIIG